MFKNYRMNRRIFVLLMILIFIFFAFITYLTPLAGDDWGYAITGMTQNPFVATFNQYFNWSGRILSELWGYLIAPNKWAWNIINPLLFTGIFFFIFKIVGPKRNVIFSFLVVIFLMLSVKDFVRMQTYTWIMGTTYVIPLFLLLVYTYLLKVMIIDGKYHKWMMGVGIILNIMICLYMENAAAALVVANILALIYCFIFKKELRSKLIIFLICSIIGILIVRLSPGAVYRLNTEHPDWVQMNIFEQISTNWPNFLRFTFLDNKYLICILSLVLFTLVIIKKDRYPYARWHIVILATIYFLGFIQSISANINSILKMDFLNILYDINYPFCNIIISILLIAYIIAVIWTLCFYLNDDQKYLGLFILMVGGSANIAMLLSPIFDSRSSLYTIYFLIMLCALFINEATYNIRAKQVLVLILLVLNLMQVRTYVYKYMLVNQINNERNEQIKYYQDHPEEEEGWFVRYPIMTIHSGDIEDWDTFHQQVFKQYYGLNPDMTLHFYYKDQY